MYTRNDLRSENIKNIINDLKGQAGVYKIYYKKPINRIVATDNTSLLYIGSTGKNNGLKKRIRDFFDSATNCTTAHSGGKFYNLSLKNNFGDANENLMFDYEICISKEAAKNSEAKELTNYLNQYGELPPLNNQLPKISSKN